MSKDLRDTVSVKIDRDIYERLQLAKVKNREFKTLSDVVRELYLIADSAAEITEVLRNEKA